MQIALKEANETGYWLELLYKTNYIGEEQYNFLKAKCKSLRAMLVSSINTAKNNNQQPNLQQGGNYESKSNGKDRQAL